MKKYFMKGTENELQFGDMIELDLTKDLENGNTKHHHLECKFHPELIPLLLADEIIEEKEIDLPSDVEESDEEIIDFEKAFFALNELLMQRLNCIESEISNIHHSIKGLTKAIKKAKCQAA